MGLSREMVMLMDNYKAIRSEEIYGQEDYSFAKLKRMTDEVESRCCIYCRNPKQMAPYVVEPSCKNFSQAIKLIRLFF